MASSAQVVEVPEIQVERGEQTKVSEVPRPVSPKPEAKPSPFVIRLSGWIPN